MNASPVVWLLLSLPVQAVVGGRSSESDVGKAVQTILQNQPGRPGVRELRAGETRVFTLAEDDLNRYLAEGIRREADKKKRREFEIKSVSLRLKEGRVVEATAMARLDAGALKLLGSEADSIVVQGLKNYLTMDNSMVLECLVSSAKGKIFVKVLRARIKEVVLPDSLVRKVLQIVGAHQRPPLDFNRMFALPNGIQRVEVLPGRLRLQVRGL